MVTAQARPEGDPLTIGFTAAAAVLLGCATVLVSTWLTSDFLQLLLGLVVTAYGVVTWRGAAVSDLGRPRPLGVPVERALGAAAALFGADLIANAVVAAVVDAASEEFTPPSPVLLTVIRYGPPLVVLAAMAFRGVAAGPVGAGLVLPTAIAAILFQYVEDPTAVAMFLLVVAMLAALLALPPGTGRRATFGTVAGTVAASFVVGLGALPLRALDDAVGTRPAAEVNQMATVLGLAVVAGLLALAVRRRDVAGALVAALPFAAPPAGFTEPRPGSGGAVLLIVPAAAVVLAVLAWARLRTPVVLATVGIAVLVGVVHAVPALGWAARTEGAVALGALVVVGLLAWRLPGPPGALTSGVVLVALSLASPWVRLVAGDRPNKSGFTIAAVLALAVAGLACWVLVRRHPRPGVVAAAAYCAVSTLAHALYYFAMTGHELGVQAPFLVSFGPLLLVGLVAAAFTTRDRFLVAAQAAGAVVLGLAGFAVAVLTGFASGLGTVLAPHTFDLVMEPVAPTGVLFAQLLRQGVGLALGAVALLVVLAALFATTLARHSSAPLAAAAAFVAVVGAQCAALLSLGPDAPLGIGPMAVIALVCGAVCAAVALGAGHRFRRVRPEPVRSLPQE